MAPSRIDPTDRICRGRLIIIAYMVFAAELCWLGSSKELDSERDPLLLRPLLTNDPIPEHVLERVKEGPTAKLEVSRGSNGRRLQQPISANALNVRPGLRADATTRNWVTAFVDPSQKGFGIPTTFLGISHEWTNIQELNHGGTYLQLLRDLTAYGGGPLVLRVGGGSTDMQTAPAPASTWDALKQLQYSTGMMFIFGLNFLKGDVQLAKSQMDTIFAKMPTYSIMAFEIGNEPNFYEGIYGKSAKDYIACCFVNDWEKFAMTMSCLNPKVSSTCTFGQFAGPVWGHVNMYPRTMDWFLKVNYQWMNLVTLHWYKATREAGVSVSSLLDEKPLRQEMANLEQLVLISRRYGKDVRIAEMNTISNSGSAGVSNSLAAALWTLDGALEIAATGAVGINLHWGDGLTVYAALLRQASGGSIVKPPYYAYLLLQMALGRGSNLVQSEFRATPDARVKVWPLQDSKTGSLRIVLINKHASAGTGVSLRLPDAGYTHGKLIRLLSKRGLADEWGVSLGNMTYNLGGEAFGVPAGEVILREQALVKGAKGAKFPLLYSVYMPPGSAALLIIPNGAGVTQEQAAATRLPAGTPLVTAAQGKAAATVQRTKAARTPLPVTPGRAAVPATAAVKATAAVTATAAAPTP